MRFSMIASMLLAAGLTVGASAQADTLAYPNSAAASFMVDYPASWEMTPGESTGDYLTLMSDGGTTLMLRTVEGDAAKLEETVKESIEYVGENYTDVELSDPTDSEQKGLTGFYTAGTASEKDLGEVRLAMAWYALSDGTIGEIWFVAPKDDTAGIQEAGAILDSFRSP